MKIFHSSLALVVTILGLQKFEYSTGLDEADIENFIGEFWQKWPYVKKKHSYESPVDINTERVEYLDLEPICIHSLFSMPREAVTIENTGYYLEISLKENIEMRPYLTGGPLDCDYIFEQMHFHWGDTDYLGSEHLLNGRRYSTEAHVVFRSERYSTVDEASEYPDGIAVVSLFGEASTTTEDNPDFEELVERIELISEPKSKTSGSFQKEFEFLKNFFEQETYYTFPSSLTTTPFQNCVTFIVYPEPFHISTKQLDAFRQLKSTDGGHIQHNDRDIQEFGDRPIVSPLIHKKMLSSDY